MNLEDRFFYRLVKVIYYFLLFVACFIGIVVVANGYRILFVGTSYVILNITREALIYIAFGQKISFQWLTGKLNFLFK